jgi:glutamyl-tRNA synthetase
MEVRVRFAPSPTGPLHIGGVRTALYNYLFAKHHGGKMILRIEDTDQNRYVPGAEEYIVESLDWCGIRFDEGVHSGGPFGPYRQSERKDIYKKYVEELIANDHAYYAFDTPEELETRRKEAEQHKKVFTYDASVRLEMKNSLALSEKQTRELMASGLPYVVRFKIPENEVLVFHDLIRDEITVDTNTLDDKVLFKSDGMPTYHLANIVDDHLMAISHVIRGEEWLPSLPLHVLLYRAFGWEAPAFAHLPLILKPEGTGKLSKRDGDRLGFPVFPIEWKDPKTGEISSGYRESGYYPEAVMNMLALLGWNPGTEQELFEMDELVKAFTLERVGRSGSRFDPEKAKWFNHQYLVKQDDTGLALEFQEILKEKEIIAETAKIIKIVGLVKERINFMYEAWDQSFFFFTRPESYDEKTIRKKWKENTPVLLAGIIALFRDVKDFSAPSIKAAAEAFAAEHAVGMGQIILPIRLCMVGGGFGPDLFTICELLGKEEVIARIEIALNEIPKIQNL